MAGIAGVAAGGQRKQVKGMLARMAHRGGAGSRIIEGDDATFGALWPRAQLAPTSATFRTRAVWDGGRPPLPDPEALGQIRRPFALAVATPGGPFLARDRLGVCPLYYGRTGDGALCFASEVKALLPATCDVNEFPPGTWLRGDGEPQAFAELEPGPPLERDAEEIALGLRLRLERAVGQRIDSDVMGAWLSGGLDSSAMVALARPHVGLLHTFAAGLAGAPDLAYARQVAKALGTVHHEVVVTLDDMLTVLPDVIYHLESFDALLVRSSITNYLVAQRAAQHVTSAFSGEGADELFAGYRYLQKLEQDQLPAELAGITRRLHNTALQRVDRSAAAHGLVVYVPFLDPEVVDYAMRIPAGLKLRQRGRASEKWILRRALAGALPERVLWRHKAKFWQGAGVQDLLAQHAEETVSDADLQRERQLPNGWVLNSKEELMYYRVFRERFGALANLDWMGRSKSAPVQ